MVKLLHENYEKMLYKYMDILTLLGSSIETEIQTLKKIKGIQLEAYKKKLQVARNLLIRAQSNISDVRERLKKDY